MTTSQANARLGRPVLTGSGAAGRLVVGCHDVPVFPVTALHYPASVVGRTYLERGRPVVVLARWAGGGPRNVLVRREDGTVVVRPFRGLRLGG